MIYPGQEVANKDWANQLRRQQHQEGNYEPVGGYAPPNNYKPEAPPAPPPYQWNNNNNYDPAVVYEQQRQHQNQGKGDNDENAARAAAAAAAVIDRFMHDPRNNGIRIAQQPDLYNERMSSSFSSIFLPFFKTFFFNDTVCESFEYNNFLFYILCAGEEFHVLVLNIKL